MGTPSLVTRFGGPEDFVTEKNSFIVPHKLVPSTYHVQSKQNESLWAESDYDMLKTLMRFAYKNRDECIHRGAIGKNNVKELTSKKCALKIIDFLRKNNICG